LYLTRNDFNHPGPKYISAGRDARLYGRQDARRYIKMRAGRAFLVALFGYTIIWLPAPGRL
jgi:hypothetical protein